MQMELSESLYAVLGDIDFDAMRTIKFVAPDGRVKRYALADFSVGYHPDPDDNSKPLVCDGVEWLCIQFSIGEICSIASK